MLDNSRVHAVFSICFFALRNCPASGTDWKISLQGMHVNSLSHFFGTISRIPSLISLPYQSFAQDNLESATYEVFENDTIKYVQYEEAIFRSLCDRKATGKVGSSSCVSIH